MGAALWEARAGLDATTFTPHVQPYHKGKGVLLASGSGTQGDPSLLRVLEPEVLALRFLEPKATPEPLRAPEPKVVALLPPVSEAPPILLRPAVDEVLALCPPVGEATIFAPQRAKLWSVRPLENKPTSEVGMSIRSPEDELTSGSDIPKVDMGSGTHTDFRVLKPLRSLEGEVDNADYFQTPDSRMQGSSSFSMAARQAARDPTSTRDPVPIGA